MMKARIVTICLGLFFFPKTFFTIGSNTTQAIHDTMSNICYIFAHGLGATHEQANLFLPDNCNTQKWLINKPSILFNFPDAISNDMKYSSSHVNLGQELDIQKLKDNYEEAVRTFRNHKFVLAGISRGAATIINYVALHQPQAIAALVLESPFDTLGNVVKHLLRRFHVNWIPFSKKIALKLAKKNFPLLQLNGVFPLNVAHKIPLSTPIFIAHSQKDKTIPINSSRNIYKSLIEAGHKDVYLLEFASGEHGKLMNGSESTLYAQVLHAFYKKYNLPCNNNYAQAGQEVLKYCQPPLDIISKKIRKTKSIDNFSEDFELLDTGISNKNTTISLDIECI